MILCCVFVFHCFDGSLVAQIEYKDAADVLTLDTKFDLMAAPGEGSENLHLRHMAAHPRHILAKTTNMNLNVVLKENRDGTNLPKPAGLIIWVNFKGDTFYWRCNNSLNSYYTKQFFFFLCFFYLFFYFYNMRFKTNYKWKKCLYYLSHKKDKIVSFLCEMNEYLFNCEVGRL